MRYISIFIVCLLLVSCKGKKVNNNDLTKMHLHDKVKVLKEADYVVDTTGQNKGNRLRWTYITEFNPQGFMTSKLQLDEKGDTARVYLYSYDKDGRKIEEKILGNDFAITNIYTHDTAHNTAVSRFINADGSDNNTMYTYKYNNTRQLLEWKKFVKKADSSASKKTQDVLMQTLTYSYDADGKLIRCDYKTADSFKQTCIYTYDKNGNCVSEIADTAKEHQTIKTLRQFDEKGNETSETAYEADGSIHTNKTEEYKAFDKTGNWTTQYTHWKDLGTTRTERTIEYYPN